MFTIVLFSRSAFNFLKKFCPLLQEARIAIEQVVIPKGEPVELLPRQSNILLLQKDLIRKYKLQAQRVGSEADVRLRILPFQAEKQDKHDAHDDDDDDDDDDDGDTDALNELSNANGSPYPVNRLPFLPD
ncbi:putative AAA domain-containing protein, R3H [Helianthus annuus]|nr:putative AAA domain-containing protein, R3H [Helianthus annuus]